MKSPPDDLPGQQVSVFLHCCFYPVKTLVKYHLQSETCAILDFNPLLSQGPFVFCARGI